MLSLVFVLGFSFEADAQRNKKKRGTKERPSATEQNDSGSERSKRSTEREEGLFTFTPDRLAYDILGDFRIFNNFGSTGIKFGLKPAVSYKLFDRLHFGIAPKIEYYFTNIVNGEDFNEFDLGLEFFGRVLVFDMIYLQAGYDINNYVFASPGGNREFFNSAVIGGGYMQGFGPWQFGAQGLFLLNERRRDYSNFPLELWFGFTYNL